MFSSIIININCNCNCKIINIDYFHLLSVMNIVVNRFKLYIFIITIDYVI